MIRWSTSMKSNPLSALKMINRKQILIFSKKLITRIWRESYLFHRQEQLQTLVKELWWSQSSMDCWEIRPLCSRFHAFCLMTAPHSTCFWVTWRHSSSTRLLFSILLILLRRHLAFAKRSSSLLLRETLKNSMTWKNFSTWLMQINCRSLKCRLSASQKSSWWPKEIMACMNSNCEKKFEF